MLKRLATWWNTQVAVQALESLDDRMLADMGLRREEIGRRVRGDTLDRPVGPLPWTGPGVGAGGRTPSS